MAYVFCHHYLSIYATTKKVILIILQSSITEYLSYPKFEHHPINGRWITINLHVELSGTEGQRFTPSN